MGERRIIVCAECKEERPNNGRGLCQTCYARLKKAGKLPAIAVKSEKLRVKSEELRVKGEKKKPPECAEDIPKSLIVQVDFFRNGDVLEGIKRRSEEQMRPLDLQIIWELKQGSGRSEGRQIE